MNRRDFIVGLGGAVAWPLAAGAQQTKVPVIGLLLAGSPEADAFRVEAFLQGLKDAGYFVGGNIAVEYRWARDQYGQLPELTSDLIERKVAVIATIGNAAALAARASNTTIPIVFQVGDDPVNLGLVSSLARPGANITGVTFLGGTLVAKLFEVLHEAIPNARIMGLLENPANPNVERVRDEVRRAAVSAGRQLVVVQARAEAEFDAAFRSLMNQNVGALLIRADVLFNGRSKALAALSAHHGLPAIQPLRDFALAGGLMSYGANLRETVRLAGLYTARVLKGEKAADLPVQQSSKVELVVNLKAAKALGVEFPQTLLARADEVIE